MAKATGKDHARVNLAIWGDDDFLDLTPAAQHLYLVLWTSPGLSYCGAGEWRPAKVAQRAKGWSVKHVERAAAELARELFLIVDTDTEEFLLRSWAKHDGLWKQPNMAVSMANARAELASRTLRGVVVFEVIKIRNDNPDLAGWNRDAVVDLLGQKSMNPADLTPYSPCADPSVDPSHDPLVGPCSDPPLGVNAGVGVDPSVDPGPTPSPAPLLPPAPNTRGGYVSTEGYDARPDDPPPATCPRHPDGTTDPCRACGDARIRRETWETDTRRARLEAERAERLAQAERTRAEIARCDLCDETGYRGGRVCSHDPDAEDRARRGLALVREAMAGKGSEA